jgi:hypothetical protein
MICAGPGSRAGAAGWTILGKGLFQFSWRLNHEKAMAFSFSKVYWDRSALSGHDIADFFRVVSKTEIQKLRSFDKV